MAKMAEKTKMAETGKMPKWINRPHCQNARRAEITKKLPEL